MQRSTAFRQAQEPRSRRSQRFAIAPRTPPSQVALAQRVGVSDACGGLRLRTLRRGFQVVFGTTVCGYLLEQRLIQAEQLLRETNWTVAEVAYRSGYSNQGHFAPAFKRKFGITPKQCAMGRKLEG